MKMVASENHADEVLSGEVLSAWVPESNADFVVALADNGIVIALNDFPKFNPMTGEPLEFPEVADEE